MLRENFYLIFHIGICQDADKIIYRKAFIKPEVLCRCKSLLIVMVIKKSHPTGLFRGWNGLVYVKYLHPRQIVILLSDTRPGTNLGDKLRRIPQVCFPFTFPASSEEGICLNSWQGYSMEWQSSGREGDTSVLGRPWVLLAERNLEPTCGLKPWPLAVWPGCIVCSVLGRRLKMLIRRPFWSPPDRRRKAAAEERLETVPDLVNTAGNAAGQTPHP